MTATSVLSSGVRMMSPSVKSATKKAAVPARSQPFGARADGGAEAADAARQGRADGGAVEQADGGKGNDAGEEEAKEIGVQHIEERPRLLRHVVRREPLHVRLGRYRQQRQRQPDPKPSPHEPH